MKRKKITGVIIMVLCVMNLWADQTKRALAFVETKVIHGFSIGVTDMYGFTNSPPDRNLCFSIWSTNKVWVTNHLSTVVFPTQPEYAYQVELLNSNGVAMPKTKLGKKVGTKFFDFDSAPSKKGIRIQLLTVDKKSQPASILVIFRPNDYFKINEPGNYVLRIRFQILAFPITGSNRGDYTKDLIRFPVLDYSLVKPSAVPKK